MWIYTKGGFFSAVRHFDGKRMMVRARSRADLEWLAAEMAKAGFPKPERVIVDTPTHDYCCRIFMQPETWTAMVATITSQIDYTNFKNAIHGEAARDMAYMNVWSAMRAFQDKLITMARLNARRPKEGKVSKAEGWWKADPEPITDRLHQLDFADDDDAAEYMKDTQMLPDWSSLLKPADVDGMGMAGDDDWDDWGASEEE